MPEQIIEPEDGEQYEEVAQPFIIETGDSIKVKQVLDDSLYNTLTDKNLTGFEANNTFENGKVLLMLLACASALVAQFYPMPFPDSRLLLFVCCAIYFIVSFILQLLMTFVEKDCILVLRPQEGITEHEVFVRTNFPRFQEHFEFILELRDGKSTCTTGKMYVGKYFTEEGEFDEDGYTADILLHVQRFNEKQFIEYTYDHKSD